MNYCSYYLHHNRHWKSLTTVVSLQLLSHQFSTVQLAAEILSVGSKWQAIQVHQKEVQVDQWSWKMLAGWMNCFLAVAGAISVNLELTALALETALQGAYKTRNNHISKMNFRLWKPPGMSERIWSVNLDASMSGEYLTLKELACWASE
jgi:hypothetical protein